MKTDASHTLLLPLDRVLAGAPHVLIIGSGPAGVSVTEYLYNVFPEATIAILERGDVLTLTHVNNVFPDQEVRGPFIDAHGTWPWKGYFENNGLMIFALGGRGIVAGGHLRRFEKDDFVLWKNGKWPLLPSELDRFFTVAEIVRNVSPGEFESRAQTWAMGVLDEFKPHPPPWGIDVRTTGLRRGLDSSAQRLCELIHRDCLEAHEKALLKGEKNWGQYRRILVSTNTRVVKLDVEHGRVTNLACQNLGQLKDVGIGDSMVVLAASPIESARLILDSNLDHELGLVAAGKYLAEHILCRTEITVFFPIQDPWDARLNVVIPPPGRELRQRFQIDVRQSAVPVKNGKLCLRISGFAAMDPNENNRIEIDGSDVRTIIELSHADHVRVDAMKETMIEIAERLGAKELPAPEVAKGRSNHEVGTLRMGTSKANSVTDTNGKVHDMENLFVADASVFPCAGVANPMLTITALAYHLAQHVGRTIGLKEVPSSEPWSLC
ncbi:MAG TPA: GMC oxidoreductase [Thermoanaerobaculia bacterium]|nr:GMC oxidoreductase [Thermoanaerobaculia bacterium]